MARRVTVDVSEAEDGTVKIESSDGDGFAITTGAAVSARRSRSGFPSTREASPRTAAP